LSGTVRTTQAPAYTPRGWGVLLAAWFLVSASASCGQRSGPAAPERPNILFIMVDDLGKEWISSYGAEGIETPHIDRLAATGMRFDNAYSMAQCTPSRVALLTGQYPFRSGWINHWDVPRWGVAYFDWKRYTTFARVLKAAGYATAAAGKWQVNDFRLEPQAMRKHGFDEWFMWTGYETGNPASAERYQDAYINTPEGSRTYEGRFGPDVFTEFLVDFMRRHRDRPMLLYYPMVLTHSPLVPTPDEPDVEDPIARHVAMVRYTDKLVGRLVAALEELRIRDRTIVMFTTDNGSGRYVTGTRAGVKVPGAKGRTNEAGVSQPFIVSCPGVVPRGVTTQALTDFTDLLPTFAELAGAPLPGDQPVDGVSIAPVILGTAARSEREWILGMGHSPALLTQKGVRPQCDFTPRVIRGDRYKVWVDPAGEIARLHDLTADPWEETNLLDEGGPDIARVLSEFRDIVAAMPRNDAWPRYRPRAVNPWDKEPEEMDARQCEGEPGTARSR
jgi:arylsulfatase A-like enzyme